MTGVCLRVEKRIGFRRFHFEFETGVFNPKSVLSHQKSKLG